MTQRSRILLIVSGITAFLILAPLAILFARGFRFDFSQGEITKTGALIVKTSPRGALLFINDKPSKTTPVTKRFLFPAEYNLRLEKTNYQIWSKTINIHPQLITNPAQKGTETIFLFFKNPTGAVMATNTLDYFFDGSNVISVSGDLSFFKHKKNSVSETSFFRIETDISQLSFLDYSNEQLLIKTSDAHLVIDQESFFSLPGEFDEVALINNSAVAALDSANTLIKYDYFTNASEVIDSEVNAFTVQGDDVYYLKQDSLVRLESNSVTTEIVQDLPGFTKALLILSPDRQIFLILDDVLYSVTDKLEKISQNVSYATWQTGSQALVYGNSSEAWLYRPFGENQNELLIRSSAGVSKPIYNQTTGHFFVETGGKIKAVETSFDGQANSFLLYTAKNEKIDFSVDPRGEYMIVLDGQELISLKIR